MVSEASNRKAKKNQQKKSSRNLVRDSNDLFDITLKVMSLTVSQKKSQLGIPESFPSLHCNSFLSPFKQPTLRQNANYPKENTADGPHVLAIIRFSPFSRQWQYKGNNERTKNKEIFTRTWVWGLVLRVCVCVCVCVCVFVRAQCACVWNVRAISSACIYQLLWWVSALCTLKQH